jgi:hypothetical protein
MERLREDFSEESREHDALTLQDAALILEKWSTKNGFWLKVICKLLRSASKSVAEKTTKKDELWGYQRHMQ